MTGNTTRRGFLGGLGALTLAGPGWARAPEISLRPHARGAGFAARAAGGIEGLIARYGLPGAVACSVADAETGKMLESASGDAGLPPASVAKTLTALYALEVLGPDHRFSTRLLASGPVEDGVLQGDLILSGGGDPVLVTDDLATMAAALKEAGIREVRGAFLVHDGMLPHVRSIDPGQPDQVAYSPAVSGIALNFNRVHFEWKRAGKGYSVTMDARTGRYRPDVQMAGMQIKPRKMPIYTYANGGDVDRWTVASAALGNGGARWLPVRKPALYAGDVFRTLARSHGIVLKSAQVITWLPEGTSELVRHQSQDLRPMLKDMLKFSTNITAEMVGLSASVALGARPENLKASAARMNGWAAKRFGMTGTALVDHSGLGGASRMTPNDLVSALLQARWKGILRPLLKPIGMRDQRGRIVDDHPVKVDAKTGTLNFVSGLGGFLTAADGREMAFAIFSADMERRARIARADRERPEGAREWNSRARMLQARLLERWGTIYGS